MHCLNIERFICCFSRGTAVFFKLNFVEISRHFLLKNAPQCVPKYLNLFRRRLSSEGAKPESYTIDRTRGQVVFVYVCMFFENISQLKPLNEMKVLPKESFVLNMLLRRGVLMVQ